MKKYKNVILFIAIIMIISLAIGFIYGMNNTCDIENYIKNISLNKINIFKNLLVIIVLFVSCLSLVGIFVSIIYTSFECISIGYYIANFFVIKGIKGMIFSIIFTFINKIVFLLLLVYVFITCFVYGRRCISNILGKNKDYFSYIIKPVIIKFLFICIVLVITDLIIYFFGYYIINYFKFLI